MTDATHFSDMVVPRPTFEETAARLAQIEDRIDHGQLDDALASWDALRRDVSTHASLARLRFAQNTRDPEARAEREYVDEFLPRLADYDTRIKRKLIAAHEALAPSVGEHVFELWEADVATFEPMLEEDLVAESKASSRVTELTANAEIEFDGKTYNLSQIRQFALDPDREVRHRAEKARWGWFADNAARLDALYDELVAIRTRMARKLGQPHYVPLGYLRRQRIDYGAADVARFRDQVLEHVVPVAQRIVAEQATALGVDKVMLWDEQVFDPSGGPKLQGDPPTLVRNAQKMFDALHPELGGFFSMMTERGLLDLEARTGKAPGGFCTSLEDFDAPFVFANFNGTRGDVEVLTHEMGHAFQCWKSISKFPLDLVWPTLESCEIHSMSLEFLCWPHMELFFGDDAERFRRAHLAESLTFLPYGCAVDHFQHLVYESPEAGIEERYEMWRQVEQTYLPWRDWGDLTHGALGGRWHAQNHVFSAPFYYIDYVLAMTCALQFWDRAQHDLDAAMTDYVALCARGGEAPFQELTRSAGLTSPFEEGCLESAVARAVEFLEL